MSVHQMDHPTPTAPILMATPGSHALKKTRSSNRHRLSNSPMLPKARLPRPHPQGISKSMPAKQPGFAHRQDEDDMETDTEAVLASDDDDAHPRVRRSLHKCETCHKAYRHAESLVKHRWQHTAHYTTAAQLAETKNHQVQMLEAAAILSNPGSLPDEKSLWPACVSPPQSGLLGCELHNVDTISSVGGESQIGGDSDLEDSEDDDGHAGHNDMDVDVGMFSIDLGGHSPNLSSTPFLPPSYYKHPPISVRRSPGHRHRSHEPLAGPIATRHRSQDALKQSPKQPGSSEDTTSGEERSDSGYASGSIYGRSFKASGLGGLGRRPASKTPTIAASAPATGFFHPSLEARSLSRYNPPRLYQAFDTIRVDDYLINQTRTSRYDESFRDAPSPSPSSHTIPLASHPILSNPTR